MSRPSSSTGSASAEPPAGATYPGERLGLPRSGPGAVAGWPRRVLALVVDWLACLLVVRLFGASDAAEGWVTLVVFWAEVSFFTAVAGGSFGQLLVRVAVVRLDRTPVNLLVSMARTVLICLVIPPVIYNRDQRGLHDLAAGTVTLRR